MPLNLILGTAGHIDHGKTSLVKALTGTDCDRLPEEKARGITIDIGFASLDLGDFRLGLVDVPGHERFIKNMLAGATGVDLALLVIAADDSVMPQTREHLEILKLLGLKRGVIALTKCDLVDATTREVVALEIRDLVAESFLADAPLIYTSAATGEGIDELRAQLQSICHAIANEPTANSGLPFRLAIDRAFVVQGHGTVVTGSVTSGSTKIGDELEWQPVGRSVRVRGLHNHDLPVTEIHRGMRAAINLAGIELAEVQRGQELARTGYLKPSRTLTVHVKATSELRRSLRHRTPIRLHIGTAEVMGVLSLLEVDSLPPGVWGLGQLFLEEPVVAAWGQPFVLRGSSAQTTIGGGRVLQPVARKIRRREPFALTCLNQLLSESNLGERIEAVAWHHMFAGFDTDDLIREGGLKPASVPTAIEELVTRGRLVEITTGHHRRMIHSNALQVLENRVMDALARLHADEPLLTSHERSRVVARLDYLHDESLVAGVIDRLISRKQINADGKRIARADFKPKLSASLRKLKDNIVAVHAEAGFQPPDPKSFANQAGGHSGNLRDIFDVAVAEGLLAKISDDVFLHARADSDLRRRVIAQLKSTGKGLTVAEIRDLLGTSRKYAVPICEYLDRLGITRREGDLRVLAQDLEPASE